MPGRRSSSLLSSFLTSHLICVNEPIALLIEFWSIIVPALLKYANILVMSSALINAYSEPLKIYSIPDKLIDEYVVQRKVVRDSQICGQ
jgi:hypothetical protein